MPIFHATIVTIFAQITIALRYELSRRIEANFALRSGVGYSGLRIYAVTGRNKLVAGGLSVLVAAQFPLGIYSIVRAATVPSRFLNCGFVRVRTHRPLVLLLPNINLDAFKTCIYGRWRLGELLFANTTIAFGTLLTLQPSG